MHFKFNNVNDAFKELVQFFAARGPNIREVDSRNGKCLMIDEPVILTYAEPRKRVLFNVVRDANPHFHLFESLWMLAGRNDVASVANYAANMVNFSDDGKVLNGAYGHRWRQFWDCDVCERAGVCVIDQLECLIDHLTRMPESRRAVLQMWDVENDLLKADKSKDVCCLGAETTFRSPEGNIPIKELARKFQTEPGFKFPVYAVDTTTGDQRLTWMTNAWKTGVKKLQRLTFDDGSTVRLTADHKVFRKKWLHENGKRVGQSVEECQVSDLTVGDRLVAAMPEGASCRVRGGGYRAFKRNIYKGTDHKNMMYEHREYISLVGTLIDFADGFSIHHKDEDRLNNQLSNLEQIPTGEHHRHHALKDNSYFKRSKASKKKFTEAGTANLKKLREELPSDLRKALFTKRSCRSESQQLLVDNYQSSKSNHTLVSIEPDKVETVYDFTVPGRHNAVLSNGVLVHNCNLSVMFSLRPFYQDGEQNGTGQYTNHVLDMTVTNRSNDLILGALGANYVHFSFLQEYMACALGAEVGVYNQISNNLHVYDNPDVYESSAKFTDWMNSYNLSHYARDGQDEGCLLGPKLFRNPEDRKVFDEEVKLFVADFFKPREFYKNEFLRTVALPMCLAFKHHKDRNYKDALYVARKVWAEDWRAAAIHWIMKRQNGWEIKQAKEKSDAT